MYQDYAAAAAAAVLRRTMVLLLMLLTFSLSSFPSVTAECPDKCSCYEGSVYCKELDRIPDRIPPGTEFLDLGYKKFRDIEPKSFTHLTELKILSLGGNLISNLKNGVFANLSKLWKLLLYNNTIENIETGCFNNLMSLENLKLDHNKIHNLDFVQSKGLARLNELELSHNLIRNIPPGIFDSLTSLRILNLSYNQIGDIKPKLFTHLTELKTLTLNDNEISILKYGAFANLSKLQTLSLDRNKIENIETGVFNNLTSLKYLFLSFNKIHKLDLEMFKGHIKLDTLSLSHNLIRNIPPGIFDSLTSLNLLMLDHNPLTCDCNILLFVNALKKNYPQLDVFGVYDPSCYFPVEMSEKSLKKLTEKDFHCTSPDVIVVPENKTLSVGEELQLSCKAVGDPEPLITWAKDDIYLELGQRVQVFKNNTLIISKVERTDGGQYKCVASNYLGRKSFEAMVNVNEKMCPPLLSDNLDIKCSFNGNYANCSNLSIPDTIATPSCKPTYALPNRKKQTSLELRCQSNGMWDKELYRCQPLDICILPTVEGVVYTYEGSNESLTHGTFIDLHITVNENCKFGYHKVHPNSFRVCQRHGKWKTVSDKLCLKTCPPLESDSLDIKCTHNGKYANCSNPSIPDTIAKPVCKPLYTASNGNEEEPLELLCQPNGTWNKELYRCQPLDVCILPTVEGLVYTYEDSNESLSHGTFIDLHLTVNENCKFGYYKVHPNSFRVCQRHGKWKTVSDKLCLKMCPPLESDSVDIKCTHNGKYANCSNPSIPDTIAKPVCKPLYTASNGNEEEPLELLCQPNGTWNKELYRCNPSCGKVYTINNGMIMGGETAPIGTAPWNVGVYRFNTKNSNNYDLICGGSIISPILVVSAAHCFWGKGMLSNRISVNDGQYKIAVGKYSRSITIIDNEFTKIMNVTTVYLGEYYYGPSGFHADDIAIVVLQNRISFSIGVSPVCVDWMGIHTIPNGAKGKIVGWGQTEKGIDSPILLEGSLPYINYTSCRNMYTNGFESYVTKDKFCAGSTLGQGAHQGDSGASLSFSHSNLYYLTGVASVKDSNTNNSIAVFTEVKHHIQWVRRLYDEHN